MSLEYIRNYYQVPAELGRRVTYTGRDKPIDATIVGARNQYLVLHLDNEPKPHHAPFHPTWEMHYNSTIGPIPEIKPKKLSKRKQKARRRYQQYINTDGGYDNFFHFLRALTHGNKLKRQGAYTGHYPTD